MDFERGKSRNFATPERRMDLEAPWDSLNVRREGTFFGFVRFAFEMCWIG